MSTPDYSNITWPDIPVPKPGEPYVVIYPWGAQCHRRLEDGSIVQAEWWEWEHWRDEPC